MKSSLEIVDQFFEKEGDPAKYIPHLREIVSNNIYGGKIDNKFDLKILDSLVHQFMDDRFFSSPESVDLVKDVVKGFKVEGHQEYVAWVKGVDATETPLWAGLPISAEDVL